MKKENTLVEVLLFALTITLCFSFSIYLIVKGVKLDMESNSTFIEAKTGYYSDPKGQLGYNYRLAGSLIFIGTLVYINFVLVSVFGLGMKQEESQNILECKNNE